MDIDPNLYPPPGAQQQQQFRQQMGMPSPSGRPPSPRASEMSIGSSSLVQHHPVQPNPEHQASYAPQQRPGDGTYQHFQAQHFRYHPAPHPPPVASIAPRHIPPTGKLTKDAVVLEFVHVETRIQTLENNLGLAINENQFLRTELARTQAEIDARVRDLENRYDAQLAALASRRRTPAANSEDETECGDVDPEVEKADAAKREKIEAAKRAAEESLAASNHLKIKQLTNKMYETFLGQPKLSEKDHLPIVEEGYDKERIPLVQNNNVRQVRFFWDKSHKERNNDDAISTIVSYAKSHGQDYVSDAGPYLNIITHGDLHARFVTKYQALQKIYRGTTGRKSTKPGAGFTKGQRDNRARGKLDVRERKRDTLPAGSGWASKKYDAAFTIQQMSDDEDTFEDGKLVPNVYTSRASKSRAAVVNEMFAEIDRLPDPRGSGQFIKRIRGEAKDDGLPATKSLQGRARRWMIDPTWLQDHPEFDLPKFIADNGRLWGDAIDPEETEALIKKSAQEKADIKKRKQMSVVGGSDKEGEHGTKRGKKSKGKGKEKEKDAAREDNEVEANNDSDSLYD